jgi:DNA-binding NtrC family response regulator
MLSEILVIDADRDVLHCVSDWLALRGHTAVVANCAADGMRHFRKCNPPVVLIEILMPEKDGIECLLEIKRLNPQTRVIAMSGGGALDREYILQTAEKLGADCVVAKPLAQHDLCALIEAALAEEPLVAGRAKP